MTEHAEKRPVENPVESRRLTATAEHAIRYSVPKGATWHAGRPEVGLAPYLSVPFHFQGGGRVWVYVHGPDVATLRGRTIVARVSILKRRRKDGAQEDYVDVVYVRHPREEDSLHRLFVVEPLPGLQEQAGQNRWFHYDVCQANAAVVITPESIKFTRDLGFYEPQLKEPVTPTVEPILQRWVEGGWQLAEETATYWKVTKEKNGRRIYKDVPRPKAFKRRKLRIG